MINFDGVWNNNETPLTKTIIFYQSPQHKYEVLIENNKCIIPGEVLLNHALPLYVGLIGISADPYLVVTTNIIELPLVEGMSRDHTQTPSITPTMYDQLLTAFTNMYNEVIEMYSSKADKSYVDQQLDTKQDKNDNSLETEEKNVVGAINELNSDVINLESFENRPEGFATAQQGEDAEEALRNTALLDSAKQDKTDNNLNTTSKTVVGAINEVDSRSEDNAADINVLYYKKQNITDPSLQTTDKTVVGAINELNDKTDTHIADKSNPHAVTKAQVGLGNVDNTSDMNKPISHDAQAALSSKQDKFSQVQGEGGDYTLITNSNTVTFNGKFRFVPEPYSEPNAEDIINREILEGYHDSTKASVGYVDNADNNLQQQIDAIASSSDVVDVVGTYAELQNYDISKLTNNDIVKVLQDSTHNNAITYYRWVIVSDSGSWEYVGSSGPYYTVAETDALLSNKANQSSLENHTNDKSNPHAVTKAQVGLGNVDNTSDLNKPISTATQAALALKANSADVYTKTQTDTLLDSKQDKFNILDYITYSKDNNNTTITITGVKSGKSLVGDITIPAFIEGLPVTKLKGRDIGMGSGCFGYQTSLVSMHLPDTLEIIEDRVFQSCTSLEYVNLPPNLTSIGDFAFQGTKLSYVELPKGVNSLGTEGSNGGYVFQNTKLEKAILNAPISAIKVALFSGCDLLKTLYLPETITTIGGSAFVNCYSLTDIYFAGSETEWDNISKNPSNTYIIDKHIPLSAKYPESAPNFEENTYYEKVNNDFILLDTRPADWNNNWGNYYVAINFHYNQKPAVMQDIYDYHDNTKQDTLTAGDNITIQDNVISADVPIKSISNMDTLFIPDNSGNVNITIRKSSLDDVLVPNTNYDLGITTPSSLTLTLPIPTANDNYSCNDIYVAFRSGSTATTLNIINPYEGDTTYIPSANSICELSFKYICGTWVLITKETAISNI